MEIKTLEHYVITLLEAKDNEIKDLETDNARLILELRDFKQKYETLVSVLSTAGEFHISDTYTWYEFNIWNDNPNFGLIESVFKEIVEKDDERKSREEIRGDN